MGVSFLKIYFPNYIQLKAAQWNGMGNSLGVRMCEWLFCIQHPPFDLERIAHFSRILSIFLLESIYKYSGKWAILESENLITGHTVHINLSISSMSHRSWHIVDDQGMLIEWKRPLPLPFTSCKTWGMSPHFSICFFSLLNVDFKHFLINNNSSQNL